MAEGKCLKHKVLLKLRRNVKTGELALACPFCDAEQPPKKRETTGVGQKTSKTSLEDFECIGDIMPVIEQGSNPPHLH